MPVRDLFAELYVAGLFADAGWSVYFPHRDVGFDFIATKVAQPSVIIRPVQVKGRYPEPGRRSRGWLGWEGTLTQIHPEMVFAISFFPTTHESAPLFTAFLPLVSLNPDRTEPNNYSVYPGSYNCQTTVQRKMFRPFIGAEGLDLVATAGFNDARP
jgi:hypothetical protein